MSTTEDGGMWDGWIGVREAARLLPSCRPGRKLHLSTVIRWIHAGRIEGRRNGRWWFVKKDEVLALLRPAGPARTRAEAPPPAADAAREQAWVRQVLSDAGF